MQADEELVRLAVQNNGLALAHAAFELQSNFGVVMTAVTGDGQALR